MEQISRDNDEKRKRECAEHKPPRLAVARNDHFLWPVDVKPHHYPPMPSRGRWQGRNWRDVISVSFKFE